MNIVIQQPNGFFALLSPEQDRLQRLNLSQIEIEVTLRHTLDYGSFAAAGLIVGATISYPRAWETLMAGFQKKYGREYVQVILRTINQPRDMRFLAWVTKWEANSRANSKVASMAYLDTIEEINRWLGEQKELYSIHPSAKNHSGFYSSPQGFLISFAAINHRDELILE